jgi:hypothetical protein
MYNETELDRYQAKTPEQRFLQILQQDFRYASKIAEVILAEAQSCLEGKPGNIRTGQMRVLLARQKAACGQALGQLSQVEVTWTVDAGAEDITVLREHGLSGLRQVRIQRLLDEALEQGALATQEDLARVLQTSLRTIKRDFAELHNQGLYLSSRGYMKGIGRGQTHKAQIIRRWLHGETYDQLSINSHHAVSSYQSLRQDLCAGGTSASRRNEHEPDCVVAANGSVLGARLSGRIRTQRRIGVPRTAGRAAYTPVWGG